MQIISILLAFEARADILCFQSDEHVIPTLRFRTQFGLAQRSLYGIFGIHKSDSVRLDTQPVHTQFVERQGESGGVYLLHRVGRSDECPAQVGRAVLGDVEIDGSIIENSLVNMQVLMVQKLRYIHGCQEMFRLHDGVVLCSLFRIDEQQSVGTETETREGGEEGQIDLSYLILAGNELIRSLTGNGCQTFGREDDVHRDTSDRNDRQHNAQQRPTDNL